MAQATNYRLMDASNAKDTYVDYRKFVYGVVKKNPRFISVLDDEDIVTDLITEAAMSDWRWDSTRGMKKESFRYQNIVFYLRKHFIRASKRKMSYLDELGHFPSNENPVAELMEQERSIEVKGLIEQASLTEKELSYVQAFYIEGITMSDIAKRNKVSTQNVSDKLQNSIRKMKKCLKT